MPLFCLNPHKKVACMVLKSLPIEVDWWSVFQDKGHAVPGSASHARRELNSFEMNPHSWTRLIREGMRTMDERRTHMGGQEIVACHAVFLCCEEMAMSDRDVRDSAVAVVISPRRRE